jgi:hypothetical protein
MKEDIMNMLLSPGAMHGHKHLAAVDSLAQFEVTADAEMLAWEVIQRGIDPSDIIAVNLLPGSPFAIDDNRGRYLVLHRRAGASIAG